MADVIRVNHEILRVNERSDRREPSYSAIGIWTRALVSIVAAKWEAARAIDAKVCGVKSANQERDFDLLGIQ